MTDKELKRLGRKELIEILIDLAKEKAALQDRVRELESKVSDKRIAIEDSGSMAEAALKLNSLFADADKAAAQYIENARLNDEESKRILEETHKKADEIIAKADAACTAKIREANLYMEKVKKAVRDYYKKHPELRSLSDEEKQKD